VRAARSNRDGVKRTARAITLLIIPALCGAALVGMGRPEPIGTRLMEPTRIPQTPQRTGDADAGLEYILYGDYIGSGFPASMWDLAGMGNAAAPALTRDGPSATLPHGLNRFTTPEGVEVVAGASCLECHASMFDGELVIGLGNSLVDFTGEGFDVEPQRRVGRVFYGEDSPEARVLNRFLRGIEALSGRTAAPFKGVNPAFRIEEVAASHRDPETLAWSEDRVFPLIDEYACSDTPAWWHVKKKHALYYNAMGRGDFGTLLMQIMVVGVEDKTHAAAIYERMDDVLAFINALEAPAYPGPIDTDLATQGMEIFADNCVECHGEYGASWDNDAFDETYPNKLVPLHLVKTDPHYARDLARSGLTDWYNGSWFARKAGDAMQYAQRPALGYIAPPLDGVWITAPYLHNGSVPDLVTFLDPPARPDIWKRSFRDDDYDLDRMGWRYEELDEPDADPRTYDTTQRGYSNEGHPFADDLTDAERRALLEYLKSL